MQRAAITCFLTICCGCASSIDTVYDDTFVNNFKKYKYCALPVAIQSRNYSCGLACLASVMTYWGVPTTERLLLEIYPKSEDKTGYTLNQLKLIAKRNHLSAYSLSFCPYPQKSLTQQILKGRPIICVIKFPITYHPLLDIPFASALYKKINWGIAPRRNHMVVAFGANKQNVLIMDPNYGYFSIPWRKFLLCWKECNYIGLLCSVCKSQNG